MKPKKPLLRTFWLAFFIFLFLNLIAAFHAYRFTHFDSEETAKTSNPAQLSYSEKLKTLLFGVKNPRPENQTLPVGAYKTLHFNGSQKLEGWLIPAKNSKGTIVLFHGFGGQKASLLDKAQVFQSLNYNTILVDFRGSGGSEGNQTTIGFKEAEDVKTVMDSLRNSGERNIILFGTSMGAAAIMKAVHDDLAAPSAIIIECPFGTTLQTVKSRFKTMGIPAFPMAYFLTFWGGTLNGFNAFDHNPEMYASKINCPTLLLYGEQDEKVSLAETQEIFKNLNGQKKLKTYPDAGHENYLTRYRKEWTADVAKFLNYEKP